MSFSGTNTQESNTQDSSDDGFIPLLSGTKPKFKVPPVPQLPKFSSWSADNSGLTNSSHSDSSANSLNLTRFRRKKKTPAKRLPPLGVFWDIENCQIPKNKSAFAVVQRIRDMFLKTYREAEFIVVCDVKKENPIVIEELHDAQVNVIHVAALSKNAADDKLRQSLRRFAEAYSAPSAVVLISSDINFASDLSDLRYRKKVRVILVHNTSVTDALILCANEHYLYESITEGLPIQREKISGHSVLHVLNLPRNIEKGRIKSRLRLLVDNCGGKVLDFTSINSVFIKFATDEYALRAQRRIQGEDVYGNKIKVVTHSLRSASGRKIRSIDGGYPNKSAHHVPPPPGFSQMDSQSNFHYGQGIGRDPRKLQQENEAAGYSRGGRSGPPSAIQEMGFENGWLNRPSVIGGERRNGQETPGFARTQKTGGTNMDISEEMKLQPKEPVELVISNLDPTIEIKELRRLLTNMLKEYVMIINLNIVVHADGNPVANIRVSSQQEAQFAISQLHRQKLGHKRIIISYAQSNSTPDPEQLKAMVITLLQEVPENQMPLFKFIEVLESRYHCTVSVSELNKLKDICKISDDHGSRIISLSQEVKTGPPLNLSQPLVPYCTTHCPNGLQSRGWCELSTVQTPNVTISLHIFTSKVNSLLTMHMGSMPLLSFQLCYEKEFHEPLPVNEQGVPLEHLLTCVPNVEIISLGPSKNIKFIKREFRPVERDEDALLKIVPPPLAPNVSLFCRELVDLLKTTERCQLYISKFIPAYHHHFGRQCRVADYGFTKLLDLFESISHVIQIIGDGSRRAITLSHQAQVRRFTSDLLRVLKVQPSKQIHVTEFPMAYEKVIGRPFNAVEYGLCLFQDLLEEVPESTVVVSRDGEGILISLPKREQTSEEIARTKQFAAEVVDLLRHSPYCTIQFNKFVPAYHHHFGHQCKVSDYGFTKLIELFEAIPDIVKIEELSDGERTVSLTLPKMRKVLSSQITSLIKHSRQVPSLPLSELPALYLREYGYPLKPELYEGDSVAELVGALEGLRVVQSPQGLQVVASELEQPETIRVRVWALLLKPPHCKEMQVFLYEYRSRYRGAIESRGLEETLKEVVQVSKYQDCEYISLKKAYVLAAQLYRVLYENGGSVAFSNLDRHYAQMYGESLIAAHEIRSIDDLYSRYPFLFFVRTVRKRCIISLNRNLAEHTVPLPKDIYNPGHPVTTKKETPQWPVPQSPVNLVSADRNIKVLKPDSPPTPGGTPWDSIWYSPTTKGLNLSLDLPIAQNPKLLGNPFELISPARFLLPYKNPWTISPIKAPDPSELPIPKKFLPQNGFSSEDLSDSGVHTTKLDQSAADFDAACSLQQQCESASSKPYFVTTLDFDK